MGRNKTDELKMRKAIDTSFMVNVIIHMRNQISYDSIHASRCIQIDEMIDRWILLTMDRNIDGRCNPSVFGDIKKKIIWMALRAPLLLANIVSVVYAMCLNVENDMH